ncbi:MAG: hypothetical protein K0B02_03285 [DPANN group archaeon]|nr:hypothetical protein [DPANN group archaeon]
MKYSELDILLEHGFIDIIPKTQYEERRLRGFCTVVLYSSGKCLIQGENRDSELIHNLISKNIVSNNKILDIDKNKYTNGDINMNQNMSLNKFMKKSVLKISNVETKPLIKDSDCVRVGSDESLKGDTFGGLIVASVKADNVLRSKLKYLGVKDSKKLSTIQIMSLAKEIMELLGTDNFSVEERTPVMYNLYSSQTILLNQMHTKVLSTLLPADSIVIDKYPGCNIKLKGIISITRAESVYIEVAAASIIARYFALMQIESLSKEIGFKLPLGSTHVKHALKMCKDKGIDFNQFAKTKFRNVKEFL